MSAYNTSALTTAIQAFADKIKQISASSATADNALKLEGLTLNEVVELIAGTTGLTVQDVDDKLTAHAADQTNPHGVTKAQVGLGNVDNFATATELEGAGDAYIYTATEGQTVFSGADDNAATLAIAPNEGIYIEVNGERLAAADFTSDEVNDTVTLNAALVAGDVVSIRTVIAERFMTPKVMWNALGHFWADKVGAAPETLNAISEIADAIETNQDAVTAINDAIATKANITYVDSEIATVNATIAALTKADIGLANVDDFSTATEAEATGIDWVHTVAAVDAPQTVFSGVANTAGERGVAETLVLEATDHVQVIHNDAILDPSAYTVDAAADTVTLNTAAADGETVRIRVTSAERFMTSARVFNVREMIEADMAEAFAEMEAAFNSATTSLDA